MPFPGNAKNTIPTVWDKMAAGAAASGGSTGNPKGVTSFAPGQGAIFTPDPTVNGPWTHTRADIPLFRTAPATSAPAPTPAPSPIAGGGTTRPTTPGGKTPGSWPRPAVDVQPPGPRKPDRYGPRQPPQPKGLGMDRRRAMLADILSRD